MLVGIFGKIVSFSMKPTSALRLNLRAFTTFVSSMQQQICLKYQTHFVFVLWSFSPPLSCAESKVCWGCFFCFTAHTIPFCPVPAPYALISPWLPLKLFHCLWKINRYGGKMYCLICFSLHSIKQLSRKLNHISQWNIHLDNCSIQKATGQSLVSSFT